MSSENEKLLKNEMSGSSGSNRGDDEGFGTMTSTTKEASDVLPKRSTRTKTSFLSSDQRSTTSTLKKRMKRALGVLFHKDDTVWCKITLAICYTVVILYSILIFVGPFILHFLMDKEDWCYNRLTEEERDMFLPAAAEQAQAEAEAYYDNTQQQQRMLGGSADFSATEDQPYPNPDYNIDPCRYVRFFFLSFITLEECDISRRLLTAVLLGGAIGYERRSADRPAGIRTMGLVSLGACFFTISSIMAFKSSTQTWDSSRVSAALPSGVGFLGGALIWKGSVFVGDQEMHQVHGLTTAASLWLSAAVGVGVGGALYLVTIYVTTLVIMILRYGPRIYMQGEDDDDDDEEEEEEEAGEIGKEEDDINEDDDEKDEAGDTFDDYQPQQSQDRLTTPAPQSDPIDERQRRMLSAKVRRSIRKSMREVPTFGS